jgi:hypothetical protein
MIRFPPWLAFTRNRPFPLGKILGALVGLSGGFVGLLGGLVIGHLLDELYKQWATDRQIGLYFENPGKSSFYEPQPGLGAFCALGTLLVTHSVSGDTGQGASKRRSGIDGALVTETVERAALRAFPFEYGEDPHPFIESFCRIAAQRLGFINADLLAESLYARLPSVESRRRAFTALRFLATTVETAKEAERLGLAEEAGTVEPEDDPWIVLGLPKNAPVEEVKATFRRLAVQFHPDGFQNLEAYRQERITEAFMKIESAYRRIMDDRGGS